MPPVALSPFVSAHQLPAERQEERFPGDDGIVIEEVSRTFTRTISSGEVERGAARLRWGRLPWRRRWHFIERSDRVVEERTLLRGNGSDRGNPTADAHVRFPRWMHAAARGVNNNDAAFFSRFGQHLEALWLWRRSQRESLVPWSLASTECRRTTKQKMPAVLGG